jgi:hypothetical protein
VETLMHGFAAEAGEAIPSSTVTGRPTAQAFGASPCVLPCGPQLTGSVRHMCKQYIILQAV